MSYLEKPWLQSYKLGPYKLEHNLPFLPDAPLYRVLDQSAKNYPTQTAILFEGRELKYHQLLSEVNKLANNLVRLGVGKGDRVCIYLPNCIEFILCYWAALKVGGVIVPTSILRTEEGLIHEVSSSGSKIIVCQESFLPLVLSVKEKCDVEYVLITSDTGYDIAEVSMPLPEGVKELRTLLNNNQAQPFEATINPQEDLCELAFTGGATGIPKGVMLTHSNCYVAALQGLPWMMKPLIGGVAGKASVLISIPLFHTYGGFIHHSAISLGLRIILLPDPRDTQKMVDCIQEHRPFLIPGVPTQFIRLADAGLKRINAMMFSGSAPLPQEVAHAIKQKTGMPISEGYGLTETSSITHMNLSAFSRITGFMSKEKIGIGVPCPETECKLIDIQTGEEVPFGQTGEVVVRGPQVMKGYWPENGSGLTTDSWLHTGDIGMMEDDGYFHIVDRIKDMVNVSGMKVYTTHVDEVLFKHPAIHMAAAFGVPDPQIPGSERVMVVICLKEEQRGAVTEKDIQDFCREKLPPYAVPKYVEFRDDMPLTVTEKVFKKTLRDEAIAKMVDK